MESILDSVKKMLGIDANYTHFDTDVIIHINSAFMVLHQLGVGPKDGFSISDKASLWSTYLDDRIDLNAVKSYVYLKVRLLFDPPTSSFVKDAIEKQIQEFEWRLNVQAENNAFISSEEMIPE